MATIEREPIPAWCYWVCTIPLVALLGLGVTLFLLLAGR